jgi:hypothetical protein
MKTKIATLELEIVVLFYFFLHKIRKSDPFLRHENIFTIFLN